MIKPEHIHSVREVSGGWQVCQHDRPVGSHLYPTRESACDRARYLNGMEEHYGEVLSETARLVQRLVRGFHIDPADAEALVGRALHSLREGCYGDLSGSLVNAPAMPGPGPLHQALR